ncbi:GNAT family N-acetyltransferase [Thermoactinomyces mirandus]|nr:GNAT family N-acetyltransferase [Thermoactinomyces mirandus]
MLQGSSQKEDDHDIRRASELGEKARKRMSEIFVYGFGKHLTFFSKDYRKLAAALAHMFVLDVFYVAVVDGEIAGMAACTNGKVSSVKLDPGELRKHLGIYKGTICYLALKSQFERPSVETKDSLASVEFVATASKYRGKGVATAILNRILVLPEYHEYLLEVADTNTGAVRLYEKAGFKEFKRVKQAWSRISGVNYLVYMKYIKSSN